MIYCPHCGTSLPDDSSFCESCGTPINQAQPATYEEPTYEEPTYEEPTYEVPTYEYEAPAYQPAVTTASAPVWIVAVAQLLGMLLVGFGMAGVYNAILMLRLPYFWTYLCTLLIHGIVLGCCLGGVAICNAVCRRRGQQELALPLSDAFVPYGCYAISTHLLSLTSNIFNLGLSLGLAAGLLLAVTIIIFLAAATAAFFLLRSASKSRQKNLNSQQNQW